jgi:tRNA A-37 threonylcarbamoyl transferase component Bud32
MATLSQQCLGGVCVANPPLSSGEPVTLKQGTQTFRDMTVGVKIDGPRARGITLGSSDEMVISETPGKVWTIASLTTNDKSRIVFQPSIEPGSSVNLIFTQLLCDKATVADGTIISFRFPSSFVPVHGYKFSIATMAANTFNANAPAIKFVFAFLGGVSESVKALEAAAVHALEDSDRGRKVLMTTIEFFDPAMTTAPVPTTKSTKNGSNATKEGVPVEIIGGAAAGACVLVTLVIVCTVCIVRNARRDANSSFEESASMGNLKSARQDADDYKSTMDHDIAQFDDSRSTRNGNYDVAPTVGATSYVDARSSYVKPPSSTSSGHTISNAMPLPPKASDFEHSVYAAVPEALRKENDPWEIDFSELVMGKVLGEGAYGTVSEATLHGRKVAVKQLHQSLLKPNDIKSFKKEAKLMKSLSAHANVVQLLAVNTDEERPPLFIVTEYCAGGACDSYLKKYGHLLSQTQRISMMVAACRGVMHLHAQSIIHRDLACRNFLLTAEGGLKVADFGMSRDTTEDGNQTKCDVGPLRYMAPESMARKTYSIETDCWAFGVVMWEIESNAATPYGDMALTMVAIGVAKEGLRLAQPTGCPDDLYALMHRCWQHKPEDRPAFAEIDEQLLEIDASL